MEQAPLPRQPTAIIKEVYFPALTAAVDSFRALGQHARTTMDLGEGRNAALQSHERGKGADEVAFLKLFMATPLYLQAQAMLDKKKELSLLPEQVGDLIQSTSQCNRLLRDAVIANSGVHASVIVAYLTWIGEQYALDQRFVADYADLAGKVVVGKQFECAALQLLHHLGRPYRTPSPEEDAAGWDYLVGDGNGRYTYINVQSYVGPDMVGNKLLGYTRRRPSGVVEIKPAVSVYDFHDRFFLPPTIVKNHALRFDLLLRSIEQSPPAP